MRIIATILRRDQDTNCIFCPNTNEHNEKSEEKSKHTYNINQHPLQSLTLYVASSVITPMADGVSLSAMRSAHEVKEIKMKEAVIDTSAFLSRVRQPTVAMWESFNKMTNALQVSGNG